VNTDVIQLVRERAHDRCEYCQLPAAVHPAPFQIDHVIARQHGGTDEIGNLALACIHCNRYKGPNIASIDRQTGELTRLFHPRTDDWRAHFQWRAAAIGPLTPIGRVTAMVLFMNDPEMIWVRTTISRESDGPR
jgi:hypothetical protein